MKKIILFLIITIIFVANKAYGQNDTTYASYLDFKDIRYFVQSQVKYPTKAAERGIEGTVIFRFKVTEKGCIDSLDFILSPHKDISSEIERVLSITNCKWKPAMYKNIPFSSWIYTKAVFKLQ